MKTDAVAGVELEAEMEMEMEVKEEPLTKLSIHETPLNPFLSSL